MNNERDKEPEVFDAEVRRVCEHYAKALALHQQEGIHLVSTDEKTGIQALERLHPDLPMRAGKVECQEHEYLRHGSCTLIANFEVATGRVIAPSLGPSRTNKDFASHIARTNSHRARGWVDLRGRPAKHPSIGSFGQAGCKGVRHRTGVG
jgi:hypothetical protein